MQRNRDLNGPESPLTELLSTIDLGDEIPPTQYLAVAEVLSFAYSLSGKTIEDLDPTGSGE